MTDISALKKVVKLVADAVNDSIKASADADGTAKLMEFQNLIPDILALLPSIDEIPKEIHLLDAESYAALVAELAVDLVLPVGKTENIVKASLKLLGDIVLVIVPDVQAIAEAAK